MPGSSSVAKTQDLTPYFTDSIKESRKIKAARLVEYEDGSRAVEIKFYGNIPKVERNIMILAIGQSYLNMCNELDRTAPEENAPLLEFMDGAQIREWRNE